jgi:hypothetical protein
MINYDKNRISQHPTPWNKQGNCHDRQFGPCPPPCCPECWGELYSCPPVLDTSAK